MSFVAAAAAAAVTDPELNQHRWPGRKHVLKETPNYTLICCDGGVDNSKLVIWCRHSSIATVDLKCNLKLVGWSSLVNSIMAFNIYGFNKPNLISQVTVELGLPALE